MASRGMRNTRYDIRNTTALATIKLAASVIVTRALGDNVNVLLVRRAPEMRFFGGYWVFPGGNVADVDRHRPGEPEDQVLRRCAIRELREETCLECDDLQPVCRITTPPFYPVRFETQFFLTEMPAGVEPRLAGSELTDFGFFDAASSRS